VRARAASRVAGRLGIGTGRCGATAASASASPSPLWPCTLALSGGSDPDRRKLELSALYTGPGRLTDPLRTCLGNLILEWIEVVCGVLKCNMNKFFFQSSSIHLNSLQSLYTQTKPEGGDTRLPFRTNLCAMLTTPVPLQNAYTYVMNDSSVNGDRACGLASPLRSVKTQLIRPKTNPSYCPRLLASLTWRGGGACVSTSSSASKTNHQHVTGSSDKSDPPFTKLTSIFSARAWSLVSRIVLIICARLQHLGILGASVSEMNFCPPPLTVCIHVNTYDSMYKSHVVLY
jgi:hypothetical protein